MEIKSFRLTNQEVADAATMFAKNEWSMFGYELESTESIAEDGKDLRTFIESTSDGEWESTAIDYAVEFAKSFDLKEWLVFVMYSNIGCKSEFCGIIAFKDWDD